MDQPTTTVTDREKMALVLGLAQNEEQLKTLILLLRLDPSVINKMIDDLTPVLNEMREVMVELLLQNKEEGN